MNYLKFLSAIALTGLLFTSCESDDKDEKKPEIVNEEEVLTTLTATLTTGDDTVVTLKTQDLDGDGSNPPVTTVSGNLSAETTYNGSIEVLNETVKPAENITEEVEEESNEHQFFYTNSDALKVTTTATNKDKNGNLLGTKFTLVTGEASEGTLTFTLRHEPKKPNTGLADADGETDIAATFNVVVE